MRNGDRRNGVKRCETMSLGKELLLWSSSSESREGHLRLPISFRISGSQGYLQFRQRVADAAEKLSWTSCCAESCPFAQVRQVSKECMIFSRWRSLSVMIQSPINTDWTLAFALLKSPSKVFRNPLVLLPYWRSIF